ncbi:Conserved_hypothetical protein [Hexamita inflata]|uniref:Glycosyl hydrolase family 13 catalytic domain-containing protein n=1 Tax=Hexamita inflata TaxID=28002 RepID=A0AA86UDH9_9EUKA|nr:Conserved hypothetical protein [Hexamita inflata]
MHERQDFRIDNQQTLQEQPNNKVFHGGSFIGLVAKDKLDYIQNQVGATHILPTPIMQSKQSHGYAQTDPHRISKTLGYGEADNREITNFNSIQHCVRGANRRVHFGLTGIMPEQVGDDTEDKRDKHILLQDFEFMKRCVQTIQDQKLELIIDIVPNHMDVDNPFCYQSSHEKDQNIISKEFNDRFQWFKEDDWYLGLGFTGLSRLNLPITQEQLQIDSNPNQLSAYNYVLSSALLWVRAGVTHLRCDHVCGPSILFWNQFTKDLRQYCLKINNKPLYIIGEVNIQGICDNCQYIAPEVRECVNMYNRAKSVQEKAAAMTKSLNLYTCFDSTFNFEAYELLPSVIIELASGPQNTLQSRAELAATRLQKINQIFFVENHDTNSLLFECKKLTNIPNALLLRAAQELLHQMHKLSPVLIYYGFELGLKRRVQSIGCDTEGVWHNAVREHFQVEEMGVVWNVGTNANKIE